MKHTKAKVTISTTLALFAMVLSFLSQTTPLWVSQTDGTPVVICSAFGSKTIIIDENGQQVPDAPTFNTEHCQMCLNASMASIAIPAYQDDVIPPTQIGNLIKPYTELRFAPRERLSIHGIRAPPYA